MAVIQVRSPMIHRHAFILAMLVFGAFVCPAAIEAAPASERQTTPAAVRTVPESKSPTTSSRTQPLDSSPNPMLDDRVGSLPVVSDARWSASLTEHSLVAVIWWIVLLNLLFIAGLPWSRLLFRFAVDQGAGFSRLLAVLLAAYIVWILASFEFIRFTAPAAAVSLLVVAAIGWWLYVRSAFTPSPVPRKHGPIISEIAFWSGFLFFLLLRWFNPDSWHPTWGGEKPMEFAHINALLRTPYFPPYDPWFSDGILNYYYYGEYLVAWLMKLSGIPSEIAYNLAQPTIMALLASGVASIGSTLATRLSGNHRADVFGASAALVIVIFMGNLVALQNLIQRVPIEFVSWTWAASRAITGGITEFPYFTGLYGDLHAHVIALPITVLIMGLSLEVAIRGDLLTTTTIWQRTRPVVLQIAVLGLALGSLSAANAWDVPLYAALVLTALAMLHQQQKNLVRQVLGTLSNALVVLIIAFVGFKPFHDHFSALFSSVARVRTGTDIGEFGLHLFGLITLIALGLAGHDFHRRRSAPLRIGIPGGMPLMMAGMVGMATMMVAMRELPALPAPLLSTVGIALGSLGAIALILLSRFSRSFTVYMTLAALGGLLLLIAMRGWLVLAASVAVAAIGALIWISRSPAAMRFTGLLIAAAGFAAAGVEIVYLVDDLQSLEDWYRMNTIFKIYNGVWITLSVAAAGLVGSLWFRSTSQDQANSIDSQLDHSSNSSPISESVVQRVLAALAIAVIAAGLLYPLLATGPRLDQRFAGHPWLGSLNALDWMDYGSLPASDGNVIAFADDRNVIDWFNDEVPGTPVIAEASIGPYRGNGSRVSIATGLPTIIGWARHESQQRDGAPIAGRLVDLRELYNSTDSVRKLVIIEQYGVEYIVVGDVERFSIDPATDRPFASSAGLESLASMVGTSLEVAFETGDTVVYRVLT